MDADLHIEKFGYVSNATLPPLPSSTLGGDECMNSILLTEYLILSPTVSESLI